MGYHNRAMQRASNSVRRIVASKPRGGSVTKPNANAVRSAEMQKYENTEAYLFGEKVSLRQGCMSSNPSDQPTNLPLYCMIIVFINSL